MSLKVTPSQTPMFYYHVAMATYQDDAATYLRKAFNGRRIDHVFDTQDVPARVNFLVVPLMKTWRVQCFSDLDHPGEFVIGIRGTNNVSNGVDDIVDQISDPRSLSVNNGEPLTNSYGV